MGEAPKKIKGWITKSMPRLHALKMGHRSLQILLSFAIICRHILAMRALILLLILCLIPHFARAADRPAGLTAQDQTDIARIELYLNELRSISADFMQIDDQGGMMHGKIAIQRPGKMRVTYDAPNKDFIVADGTMVHIWNGDLKSQTNIEESSSLAEFILRDPVRLSGDVTVTSFKRFPAKLEITLLQTNDPAAGQLTLIFEDHPLLLRQWRVIDAMGHTTGVNLENEESDVTFPHNTFSFVPPDFGKGGKAENEN